MKEVKNAHISKFENGEYEVDIFIDNFNKYEPPNYTIFTNIVAENHKLADINKVLLGESFIAYDEYPDFCVGKAFVKESVIEEFLNVMNIVDKALNIMYGGSYREFKLFALLDNNIGTPNTLYFKSKYCH